MSIVLFAIIGGVLNLGTAYWVCFSIFCAAKAVDFLYRFYSKIKEEL